MKDKHNTTPNLKWCIVKCSRLVNRISRIFMLYLHKKYESLNCPDQEELLNKSSKLVSKCLHVNKFPLPNHNSNDYCMNQLVK